MVIRLRKGVLVLSSGSTLRIGLGPEGLNLPVSDAPQVERLRRGAPDKEVNRLPFYAELYSRGYLERPDPNAATIPDRHRRLAAYLGRLARADLTPDTELLARVRQGVVWLIGLGGGGSNLSYGFARSGVGTVVGIDPATVDPPDFNRQLYTVDQQGEQKAPALANLLETLTQFTGFVPISRKIGEESDLDEILSEVPAPDLVILTADEPPLALRRCVDRWVQKHSIPYFFIGLQETAVTSGPLVIPDRTACFGCYLACQLDRHPGYLNGASDMSMLGDYGRPSALAPVWHASALILDDAIRYLLFKSDTQLRLAGKALRWHVDELLPEVENFNVHTKCLHGCRASAALQ